MIKPLTSLQMITVRASRGREGEVCRRGISLSNNEAVF